MFFRAVCIKWRVSKLLEVQSFGVGQPMGPLKQGDSDTSAFLGCPAPSFQCIGQRRLALQVPSKDCASTEVGFFLAVWPFVPIVFHNHAIVSFHDGWRERSLTSGRTLYHFGAALVGLSYVSFVRCKLGVRFPIWTSLSLKRPQLLSSCGDVVRLKATKSH